MDDKTNLIADGLGSGRPIHLNFEIIGTPEATEYPLRSYPLMRARASFL